MISSFVNSNQSKTINSNFLIEASMVSDPAFLRTEFHCPSIAKHRHDYKQNEMKYREAKNRVPLEIMSSNKDAIEHKVKRQQIEDQSVIGSF